MRRLAVFFTGILFPLLMLSFFGHERWVYPVGAICLGALLICLIYRSVSVSLDYAVLIIPWAVTILFPELLVFFYAYLGTVFLVYVSRILNSRFLFGLTVPYAAGAFALAFVMGGNAPVLSVVFICCTVLTFFAGAGAFSHTGPVNTIDAILCSYSGNTVNLFEHFRRGLADAGAEIAIHQFRYHKGFRPELNGDALVIAFPVIGWKMPWPLLVYLMKGLPRSTGKPAFIIYSAAGGPENAGFLAWALLSLKGYRVKGISWAIYPVNIATIRLGTKRFWRRYDHLLPLEADSAFTRRSGAAFARGEIAGSPVIAWPSPLTLFGPVVENPVVNRIYRHYAWKKRCRKCGVCVRVCPTGRISQGADGFPRAKGDCILCLNCINYCPVNAMHLFLFTEYGQPYHARWPEPGYWKSGA